LAKKNGENFVVKGSGKPLRQFIYSEDLARLMMRSLLEYDGKDSLILADEKEYSIGEVAGMIARAYGMEDRMVFDQSSADGQYKKTANVGKLKDGYGELKFVEMEEGIKSVVRWFIEKQN
jgi:GDP-L-fucose synthase